MNNHGNCYCRFRKLWLLYLCNATNALLIGWVFSCISILEWCGRTDGAVKTLWMACTSGGAQERDVGVEGRGKNIDIKNNNKCKEPVKRGYGESTPMRSHPPCRQEKCDHPPSSSQDVFFSLFIRAMCKFAIFVVFDRFWLTYSCLSSVTGSILYWA